MKDYNYIDPYEHELPSEYADRLGLFYAKNITAIHKKKYGQFFTPIPIAKLMASFCSISKAEIKILDPGCGSSILSCALIEYLYENNNSIRKIELKSYEVEPDLISFSNKILNYLQKWLKEKEISFSYLIYNEDFILKKSEELKTENVERFDVIIANPPYFKLSKNDCRVITVSELIGKQTNIYSIFMGLSAKLLSRNGELIFITPRSFASGKYFETFRNEFFSDVQLDRIHIFNSRNNTFKRDKVLQETVIIKAIREQIDSSKRIFISSSQSIEDIATSNIKSHIFSDLINLNTNERILHIPINDIEEMVLRLVTSWNNTLTDFNWQISTGPVVSFRALKFIESEFNHTNNIAPLFWLHNVDKMSLEWPKSSKEKGQFIRIEEESKSILIANKNYVFLRRFSTKDDKSRLIAAPYFCNYVKTDYIGVENKLNYIYKKDGHLVRSEVVGLCALLNSKLFDIYFQIFNGNVNVSATELRQMKVPPMKSIKLIGERIILSNDFSMERANQMVTNYFEIQNVLR